MKVGVLDDKYNTFIILEDISLNIYNVANQIEKAGDSWLSKNFFKISKKIKRPEELIKIIVMLRFDSNYFDNKFLKSIPISYIKKHSRLTLIVDDAVKEEERKFTLREARIIRLFQSLDQKRLIERTIVEIQGLNTEKQLMDYYVNNFDWISFKDLFDLYYTFKVIK